MSEPPSSESRRIKGFGDQLRLILRTFEFLKPVKKQVAVFLLVATAACLTETAALKFIAPALEIVKNLATQQTAGPTGSQWSWFFASEGSGAMLRTALLWLFGARFLLACLNWGRHVAGSWMNMSMVFYMRSAVYDRLQRVGFAFHDSHSTGQLINRALSDLQNTRNFVQVALGAVVDLVLAFAAFYGLLLYTSPQLAKYVLIPFPFWLWALRRMAVKSQPIYERQMKASDETVRVLTENIAGVHVVRAFATEDQEKSKFGNAVNTQLDRMLEGIGLQVRMNPLLRAIAAGGNIMIFTIGAHMVLKNELEFGQLVMFQSGMNILLGRLQQINTIADAYQQAVVSGQRFYEVLDSPDTTPEVPDAEPLRPGGGAVKFKDVRFGYLPGKEVLKGVTFDIPAGSRVALVGPTGGGKTTVSTVLARFYDPQQGSIEIDGQPINEVTLKSIRDSVGFVFQENYLFSDSVARNIAYADTEATMEQIKNAARVAHATEFIEELPEKFDTVVGERGASLSGGQRQRLAIARAVLHNPRILVLDDALSAVDPETEAQIRGELAKIMKGRTVFMITSRISTARSADRILVIENGQIVQAGTHNELMAQDGYYRAVATSQFAEETDQGAQESHMDRMNRLGKRSNKILEED